MHILKVVYFEQYFYQFAYESANVYRKYKRPRIKLSKFPDCTIFKNDVVLILRKLFKKNMDILQETSTVVEILPKTTIEEKKSTNYVIADVPNFKSIG